jgi:hypothetical protein
MAGIHNMANVRVTRPVVGRIVMFVCVFAMPVAGARAQSNIGGSILGGFFKGIQVSAAASAWKKVDQQTQSCLAGQYNLNASDLVAQGILPSDPRIAPDIQACQSAAQAAPAPEQQASVEPQDSTPKPDKSELTRRYGHKAADLIVAGQIAEGMNEEEVTLAWGEPGDKDASTPGREVWNYGNDKVEFKHGKVSDVRH